MSLKNSLKRIGLDAAQLYAMVPSAIFTVDKEKRITSWNQQATNITGYAMEEVMGKKCSMLEGGESCSGACALFTANIPKPVMNRECYIKTKNGDIRTLSKNIDLLRDENGNVIGGIECFVDITNRKKSEEVLKKQAEIVNFIDHPLYVMGRNMRYLFGNKSLLNRLKLTSLDQLTGKHYSDFHSPEETATFTEKMVNVFELLKPLTYPYHSKRRHQTFLRTLSPHFNKKGEVVSVSVSSREVDKIGGIKDNNPMNIVTNDLVSICAYCKKISDEEGQWQHLEAYFGNKMKINFSHGICPTCSQEAYQQLDRYKL
jgi:PAS domain S-box-containing protein